MHSIGFPFIHLRRLSVLVLDRLLVLVLVAFWQQRTLERLSRLPHDGRDRCAFREHHLELFETATHSLRVEEPHNGNNNRRNAQENEVVLPANGFNRNLSAR